MIEEKYIYNFLFMRNFRLFLFAYSTRTSTIKHYLAEKSGKMTGEEIESVDKNVSSVLSETKTSLKIIKRSVNGADAVELDKLDRLLERADRENSSEKEKILRLITTALNDRKVSDIDKKSLNNLKMKYEKDYVVADTKKEAVVSVIKTETKQEVTEAKKTVHTAVFKKIIRAPSDLLVNGDEINDKDSAKSLEARIRFLSNLDHGNEGFYSPKVEKTNKIWGSGNQKYIL